MDGELSELVDAGSPFERTGKLWAVILGNQLAQRCLDLSWRHCLDWQRLAEAVFEEVLQPPSGVAIRSGFHSQYGSTPPNDR